MTLTPSGETQGSNTPLQLALLKKLHQWYNMWLTQAQNQQKKSYDKQQRMEEAFEGGGSSMDQLTGPLHRPTLSQTRSTAFWPLQGHRHPRTLTYKLQLPNHWRVNNVFHRSKLTAVAPPINGQENHITNPSTVTQTPHIGGDTQQTTPLTPLQPPTLTGMPVTRSHCNNQPSIPSNANSTPPPVFNLTPDLGILINPYTHQVLPL